MNKRTVEMIRLIDVLNYEHELTEDEFSIVKLYSKSIRWGVRWAVAENLGIVDFTEENRKLLLKLLRDRRKEVASQACESLGEKGDTACLDALKRKAESGSYMVRGYAANAVAKICKRNSYDVDENAKWLEMRLKSEKNGWTRSSLHCALFAIGKKEHLEGLVDCLKDEDFNVRIAAASMIEKCAMSDAGLRDELKRLAEEKLDKTSREYAFLTGEA